MTLDICDPREDGRLCPEAILPAQQRWLPFWLLTPIRSTCRLLERQESQGDKDKAERNTCGQVWE